MGEEEVYKAVFAADADELVSESKRASKSLVAFSKNLEETSKRLLKWGAAITASIGGTIAQSLRAAAAVEEMSSRFRITFKDMSASVEKWATDYAARIGRSRFEIMAMASDLKVLLTAFGLEEKAAISAAKALTRKAQDVASFRDMHAEEVFNKIAAALSGEAEGLARIGIFTKEAQIKQLALNKGLAAGTKDLDDITKVGLRHELIMRGLKEANDDAERTSRSLTNQWRAMEAVLKDLNVVFGRIFVEDAKGLIGVIVENIQKAVKWIEENEKLVHGFSTAALQVGILAVKLGALGIVVAKATKAYAALKIGTLGLQGAFLGLTAVGLVTWKSLDNVAKKLTDAAESQEWYSREIGVGAKALAQLKESQDAFTRSVGASGEAQRRLVKAFEETWETASRAAESYGSEVDALGQKMQNLLDYHAELTEAQASFAQAAEDAMFELAKKTMPEAEVALADYTRLVQEIEALWPEIVTGSTEAILEMEKLISQVPSLNLEQLAQAWGVSVEAAQAKLSELVASTQKDVEGIADLHKKVTEDVIKTTTKRLESLEKRVEDIAESMKDLQMDVDVEGALKSLDSVLAKVGEVQERALAATGIAAGPGLGSPGLDRLSTAKVSPRVGRSGGNVVNVSATIPITRAEPVTAMAKAVASEIGRMRRRGQVKW